MSPASLLGVLLAAALLGAEIWVVGVWLLAGLAAAREVTPQRVLAAAAAFALSATAYVAAVVLIALALERCC